MPDDQPLYNPVLEQLTEAFDTCSELEAVVLPTTTPSAPDEASKATTYKATINRRTSHYDEFNEALETLLHIDAALSDYIKSYNVNNYNKSILEDELKAKKNTLGLTAKKREWRAKRREYFDRIELLKVEYDVELQKQLNAANTNPAAGRTVTPAPTTARSFEKIPIKVFRNDKSQSFTNFWSLFTTIYDANTDLTGIQKLVTLISFLDGEPLRAIESIPITEANYEVVKNELKRKYQNEQAIISKLYYDLNNLKPCNNSPEEFDYSMTLDSITRQLEGLGKGIKDTEMWRSFESKLTLSTIDKVSHKRELLQEAERARATVDLTHPYTKP